MWSILHIITYGLKLVVNKQTIDNIDNISFVTDTTITSILRYRIFWKFVVSIEIHTCNFGIILKWSKLTVSESRS